MRSTWRCIVQSSYWINVSLVNIIALLLTVVLIHGFVLDFCDYYLKLFKFLSARNDRLGNKKLSVPQRNYILARERDLLRERRLKPCMNDFELVSQIGKGAFGEIHLARHKATRKICALKTVSKKFAQHPYQKLSILTERDILAAARSDYLVHLKYAFQDKENLYLGMDFMPGGDFRTFLNNNQPLDSDAVKFYFAEMVLGVGAVHDLGYIHRDIKPENFLLSADGHVKLTDFGLACGILSAQNVNDKHSNYLRDMEIISKGSVSGSYISQQNAQVAYPVWARETVGSTDYMAVEVLQRRSYNKSVDFWSLGCVFYEMLTCFTPFQGSHEAILNWHLKFGQGNRRCYDEGIDPTSWNLLTKLITDPIRRLQSCKDVLSHPAFPPNKYLDMMLREVPFKPALDSDLDVRYFDDFNSDDVQALYLEIIMHRKHVEKKAEREMMQRSLAGDPGSVVKYPVFTFKKLKH